MAEETMAQSVSVAEGKGGTEGEHGRVAWRVSTAEGEVAQRESMTQGESGTEGEHGTGRGWRRG